MPSAGPSDALARALDEAASGRRQPLFDLLARGSHLPGKHANTALADAFAQACRSSGARSDPVALALARLSPGEAPGATALEFLPVCGLHALGLRAAVDAGVRARFLAELHAHADDARFRVRQAVVEALARIGQAAGESLVDDVAPWMDGYFHAAAVVGALASDPWLGTLQHPDAPIARLREAFVLARQAPRSAARWPGHKELVLVLDRASSALAARFGVPVFDLLAGLCEVADPVFGPVIERAIRSPKLAGKYAAEVALVKRALAAARPAPRNPDHDVGSTRDRSRRRRGR